MTEPVPPLLEAVHVSKNFPDGEVQALRDVSLRIDQGEYVALLGASGSGKSTLLNLLGALDRPTSGEVLFQGAPLDARRDLDELRARYIGFVFQSFYLLPVLTALENVQVPMFETQLTAAARRQRAAELLEVVGMSHRASHLPQRLSVGERQRVAIARSLANQPLLLLADEPTGNLDSRTASGIFELFRQLHRERHMTLLLVTHDPALAAQAARRVRLSDGCIVEDSRG